MERKALWVVLILVTVVIIAAGATYYFKVQPSEFNGSVIDPPMLAPEIRLTGPDGSPVRLSDFRGRIVLLFFGYTNCPDECPATLAILRQVRNDLGEDAAAIQVLLVTTDPLRDTPSKMAQYLSAFDSSFIGLTGSSSDLSAVYQDYEVTVMDDGETHSSRVYVVDREGNLGLTLPAGLTTDQIEQDLRIVLSGG